MTITPFATTDSYPQSFANAVELPERQARIVDISRYWRTGGIDWPRLKENFDGVVICAGVGMRQDTLLVEHGELAKEHEVPYNTFHIPDPLQNMKEQAAFYVELPGVKDAKPWFDWERPYIGSRPPNAREALDYVLKLEILGHTPGIYSRWDILVGAGLPSWLSLYYLWIARYLYEAPAYTSQYQRYEPFFEQRGWTLPKDTPDHLRDNVIGWQISDRGDAQYYCANRLTADPINVYGMTNADLNVSIKPVGEFMKIFTGHSEPEPDPPPTPEPCCICKAWGTVRDLANNAIQNCKCKKE